MDRQFSSSQQGLKIIRDCCKLKCWIRDTEKNDAPLIAASKILEPTQNWPIDACNGRIYADGINEGSWRRFLMGKDSIAGKVFVAYCHALGVNWENVVDWTKLNSQIPFIILPKVSVDGLSNFSNKSIDCSEFVGDVTIPDGTIMQPGEEFTKVWEIRNAGNVIWDNRYLKRLGALTGLALITSKSRVKISKTLPGELVKIAVKLKAPEVATTTTAIWKMTFSNGVLCFPDRYTYGLSVVIQVLQ